MAKREICNYRKQKSQLRNMEMKEVLCREGRDAKNLLVYQICNETPTLETNIHKHNHNNNEG